MKRASILLAVVLTLPFSALAEDWAPVTAEELAARQAVVEPGADAEAFFWQVRVKDELEGDLRSIFDHYIRIKIFTDRGKETHGTVELTYTGQGKIKDIEGRTIKPDGSILPLGKDAIFERNVVKGRGFTIKAKSFALPGVEPGCLFGSLFGLLRAFG